MQVEYLSLDPAMRAWMNAGRSYVPPVEIGEVMRAAGIGRVVESRHPDFEVGDERVRRLRGAALRGLGRHAASRAVDTSLAPAPVHLGALGISGLTAYFGLLDVGRPEPGQTVVVSGAAGLGRQRRRPDRADQGLPGDRDRRRAGEVRAGSSRSSASTPRSTTRPSDVRAQLREHAPDGVDVFFDNVGGEILDAVLRATRARRARRALRRDLAVQRHRGAARARPTTCSCSSRGRR